MYFIEKTLEFDKWLAKIKGFKSKSKNFVQNSKTGKTTKHFGRL